MLPTLSLLSPRALLSLRGPASQSLLHGLFTSSVLPLSSPTYGALLHSNGRLLSPAFVLPHPQRAAGAPDLLLDVHADMLAPVEAHIRRYKLRSKVTLGREEEWRVIVDLEDQEGRDGFVDMRAPGLGSRRVVRADDPAVADAESAASLAAYTLQRSLLGVAETPEELVSGQALPLEASLELQHGVDFRKGCYVGQELTARTHHTGVVRKRIVPVMLYPLGETMPPIPSAEQIARARTDWTPTLPLSSPLPASGSDIRSVPLSSSSSSSSEAAPTRRGKAAGRLLSVSPGGVGLALLRLEQVRRVGLAAEEGGLTMSVAVGEGALGVRPWCPHWWPAEVREGEKE